MSKTERSFDHVSLPKLIGVTACGWCLVVAMIVSVASPGFDAAPRTTITGEVVGFGAVKERDGLAYDILVRGYPVRFRLSPELLDPAKTAPLLSITAGTVAEIVARRDRLESPSTPLFDPTPTVRVDALALNGSTVLALADAKRWDEQNRTIAVWMMPVFFAFAAYLTFEAVLRVRRRHPAVA